MAITLPSASAPLYPSNQAPPAVGGYNPTGGFGGSFTLANTSIKPRLVVALDGLEKQGKTNFALTAPGPLVYQNWDFGDEGVVQKFQSDKVIYRADYGYIITTGDTQQTIMEKALPEWLRMIVDYRIALQRLREGAAKTLIKDTSSEEWKQLRLARFGKLTQIMPHHYTALNAEYENLIKEVYDTPGNMVLLHRLKSEWQEAGAGSGGGGILGAMGGGSKGGKTGQMIRDGYSQMGNVVQVNALAWREAKPGDDPKAPTGPFHITVRDCRQNPNLAGLDLCSEGPLGNMCTFAWLAVHVYPNTTLTDWE